MTISNEAIEAAYAAINYPYQQCIDRDEILIILEAAAPHMLTSMAQCLGDATAEVLRLRAAAVRGEG